VILSKKENELIDRIKDGDTHAFRHFVELYEKPISNVVIGMLGNTEEAENVAQDVFIRFYFNIHKFRKESGIKTYLTRIAINLSLNELKRRKKSQERIENTDNLSNLENRSFQNPDNFELRETVERELQKLDKHQRSVFVLRIIEGYSTRETAEILKIPQGTVLSRLHRAIENMKEKLKEFEYDMD
jgi:RNA polymerase sigma-70 factor (ECF subfamily)